MLWMMSFFVFAGGMLIHLTVAAKGLIRTRTIKMQKWIENWQLAFWDIDHSGASMRLLCRAGASKPQLYYVYGHRQ